VKGNSFTIGATLACVLGTVVSAEAADPYLSAPSYAKPVAPKTTVRPIVTVGQKFALSSDPSQTFRFVGIPDGLGIYKTNPESATDNHYTLLANHEFNQPAGGAAGPLPSGARITALDVTLDPRGGARREARRVVSGQYAIERGWAGEPPVQVDPVTRGFARFCSAFLADDAVGFDRDIYLNGEETAGPATFDPAGGSAWATVYGDSYQLPRIGRSAWENVVVARGTGDKTVIFALEDGPSSGDGANSQLYMYVGQKQPGAGDALSINGLNNGLLYVFCGNDAAQNSEVTFTSEGSSISGHWAQVDYTLNDTGLDAASRTAGAFGFIRIEDGTNNPSADGQFYFVTTGKPGSANPYGRVYRLNFDATNPLAGANLTILVNSTVNELISPDNVDMNVHGELAICEDPNYNLSMLGLTRDTGFWIYNIATDQLELVAEIDRESAKNHAFQADSLNTNDPGSDTPGGWEFSGVIDAERFLGRGAWILDIQAHSLRINPVGETVEGGQIFEISHVPGGGRARPRTDDVTRSGDASGRASDATIVSLGVSPNPFRGKATVNFVLANAAPVDAAVYSATGALVRRLAHESFDAGEQRLDWDGRDDDGRPASSGVYFVRLTLGATTREARITVAR